MTRTILITNGNCLKVKILFSNINILLFNVINYLFIEDQINKIKQQMERENDLADKRLKAKQRCYDKERITKLAEPRKVLKIKLKRKRKILSNFNCSVDINQKFPEISGNRSKLAIKDILVNAQKANIYGVNINTIPSLSTGIHKCSHFVNSHDYNKSKVKSISPTRREFKKTLINLKRLNKKKLVMEAFSHHKNSI